VVFAREQYLRNKPIVDRLTAEAWVANDERHWRTTDSRWHDGPESAVDDSEDPAETPATAIGFWMFSIDAFEPLPDFVAARAMRLLAPPITLDMSNHWPELALASLVWLAEMYQSLQHSISFSCPGEDPMILKLAVKPDSHCWMRVFLRTVNIGTLRSS
jgi:hypothetical protein